VSVLPGFHAADRTFFARDVLEVAPELLGCVLRRTDGEGTVSIRITEVEAYAGERDPGAHAYGGKTDRNKTMFGPAGRIYCYFTYGMHHAINLVTAQPGQPYGCLIRAGDVIEGAELARARREAKPRKTPLPERQLASGPGCVAQCLAADLTNDGDDLFDGQWQFLVPDGHTVVPHVTGPRVGLSGHGGDGAEFPWRYWVNEAPSVSTYKPGRALRRRPPLRSVLPRQEGVGSSRRATGAS
jgi:DNA-3-methyladenine glycosylase